MKLRNNQGTVETEGLAGVTNFSIKVNGKAFKILLDGLYSDKPGAVIRELSTNAYDAHIAMGKENVPFDVTLPTQFNPVFSVRDYGVSMTHEQLDRLLSTVFESSKDNANNQVGAFGLGSKSPFSMVDTYNITAWKDGEKRSYSAFYNTDGMPSLALLGTEKTTEPQGIEFSMVVNARDVETFRRRAPSILRWFPTIPNVKNAATPVIKPTPEYSGNGWVLYKRDHDLGQTAFARQGCVVYPLNAASIPGLTSVQRELIQRPLVIDFAIGDLDVAASREALGYDDTTCSNIVARLNAVIDELQAVLGKDISDAPTLWEAGVKRLAVGKTNMPRAVAQTIMSVKWQGKTDLTQGVHLNSAVVAAFKPDECPRIYGWDRYRMNCGSTLVLDTIAQRDGTSQRMDYGESGVFFYFVVEGDRPTHEGRRMSVLVNQLTDEARKTSKAVNYILLYVLKDASHKDKVLADLGGAPFGGWLKDVELPAAPPNVKVSTRKKGTTTQNQVKAYPLFVDPTVSDRARGKVKVKPEEIVELKDDAYYVITHDGDACYTNPKGEELWIKYDMVKNALVAHQSKPSFNKTWPVYMISTVYDKRVKTFGKWSCLFSLIAKEAETALKVLEEERKGYQIVAEANSSNLCKVLLKPGTPLRKYASSQTDSPMHKLFQHLESLGGPSALSNRRDDAFQQARSDANALVFIMNPETYYQEISNATDRGTNAPEVKALTRIIQDTVKAYPLYTALSQGYYRSEEVWQSQALADYIEAYDLLQQQRQKAKAAPAPTISATGLAALKKLADAA